MYIYYDPNDNNRIKAIYSGRKPKSKVWAEQGYILKEVPKVWKPSLDHLYDPSGLILDPLPPPPPPEPHKFKGKAFKDMKRAEKDELLVELLTNAGMVEDGKVK